MNGLTKFNPKRDAREVEREREREIWHMEEHSHMEVKRINDQGTVLCMTSIFQLQARSTIGYRPDHSTVDVMMF